MGIHHNARTCPRSRELIIHRMDAQEQSVQDVAGSLGISERRAYKWLVRYRGQGRLGLVRSTMARILQEAEWESCRAWVVCLLSEDFPLLNNVMRIHT